MESIQQPSVLAMPFANNGTKNNIPASPTGTNKASLSEGFPQITSTAIASGGIPPERADMNALGNIATMFYYFMQCGGAYTFRADVSSTIGGYPKGALLWYIPTTGIPILVVSTINNNTNNFNTDQSVIGEVGSGKPWEIVTVSPQNFMDLTTNQTADGTKTFLSSPVIPTPSTSDNSTKSATTEFVWNLIKDKVYPIGSFYTTKTNTNPSTILGFGTWSLISNKIVTGISGTAPVVGDGKSIGLTKDGETTLGLFGSLSGGNVSYLSLKDLVDGGNTELPATSSNNSQQGGVLFGLTPVASESGMIADISGAITAKTLYIWERTA